MQLSEILAMFDSIDLEVIESQYNEYLNERASIENNLSTISARNSLYAELLHCVRNMKLSLDKIKAEAGDSNA